MIPRSPMSWSTIIPNHRSRDTRLPELGQKLALLSQGGKIFSAIKKSFVLSILGFALVTSIGIPVPIVALLIGTEIVVSILASILHVIGIRSIVAVETRGSARGFRTIIVQSEYYAFLESIIGVVANVVSVVVILRLFPEEIAALSIRYLPSPLLANLQIFKYLLFILVAFRGFEFLLRILRYHWIKNLSGTDNVAQLNLEYVRIEKKIQLTSFIPGVAVILVVLFVMELPFIVFPIVGGFALLFFTLSVFEIQRMQSGSFEETSGASPALPGVAVYPNEQVVGVVFGILRVAANLKDVFTPSGFSFLGKGTITNPENTLLITNERLVMIHVPVTGGGTAVLGNINYTSINHFYNRAEIKERGEQLLKMEPLSDILKRAVGDAAFRDMRSVHLQKTQITITLLNGGMMRYSFIDAEYFAMLQSALQPLKERLTVQ